MASMNNNRVPKGVSTGGQFSTSAATEVFGVELASPDTDFAVAMSKAGLEIEDFERPEGPKSFFFSESKRWNSYLFVLNADGTETHEGMDMSGASADVFQSRMAWNFGYDLDKARADAAAPSKAVFDEVQRIRALPIDEAEVEARHQRHLRLATHAFKRMDYDVYGGHQPFYELLRKDPEAFLGRWDADAERGACEVHGADVAAGRYTPCYPCRFAFTAAKHEGKLNPPVAQPTEVRSMPARPKQGETLKEDWDEDTSVTERAVSYEPDESLANALRRYAESDPETPVTITEETWEDSSQYTVECSSSIEVKVGDKELHFKDLGDLMRRLDGTLRGDLSKKAKQFMGPDYNREPCFEGPAALHLHRNHGGDRVEVGWILNHYPQDRKISFQYADGRHDYLQLASIKDITPTDRTREHPGYGK